LLETSPLLQLREVRDMINNEQRPFSDTIYNCTRGYTALWQIENNKLFLLAITSHNKIDNIVEKILKLDIVKGIGKVPLYASWVSGKLLGGGDAVKTNYGYAFKQEYEFDLNNGILVKETRHEFPVGCMETNEILNNFLIKNNNVLLDGILNVLSNVKRLQAYIADTSNHATYFFQTIPLTVNTDGDIHYVVNQNYKEVSIYDLSKEKYLNNNLLVSGMNFANMLPKRSFYPRFLRDHVIYQPIYIRYEWSLSKNIREACLLHYDPPRSDFNSFWRRGDDKNPR
jgi:hypothetical protein